MASLIHKTFLIPVALAAVMMFGLLKNIYHEVGGIPTERISIVAVTVNDAIENTSVQKNDIKKINTFLSTVPFLTKVIVFTDVSPETTNDQFTSFITLLQTIQHNPLFIYGTTMLSIDRQIFPQLPYQYSKESTVLHEYLKMDFITLDTVGIYSDSYLHYLQLTSSDPNTLIPTKNDEEKLKEYQWMTALLYSKPTIRIILTQQDYRMLPDTYQQAIMKLLCQPDFSMYLYMTDKENLYNYQYCPSLSADAFSTPNKKISLVGLTMQHSHIPRIFVALIHINNGLPSIEFTSL